MRRKKHRRVLWIIVGMVLLLGLAACSGSGASLVLEATQAFPEEGSGIGTEPVPPPFTPTTAPSIDTDVATEASIPAEPTETTEAPDTEEAAAPPIREGLEATDPSTVHLASGKVQLVEFFAFW